MNYHSHAEENPSTYKLVKMRSNQSAKMIAFMSLFLLEVVKEDLVLN
jgi:hypothetical protein